MQRTLSQGWAWLSASSLVVQEAEGSQGSRGVEWGRRVSPLLTSSLSCIPGATMALAAAEAKKGPPVVVGLLVAGNVAILVSDPQCWGLTCVVGGGCPEPGVGVKSRPSSQSSLVQTPALPVPSKVTLREKPDFFGPPLPPLPSVVSLSGLLCRHA